MHSLDISHRHSLRNNDHFTDNESEYFSETLAAESLSQYQPQPKHTQNPIVPVQQYMSAPQNSQQVKPLQTATTTPYSQQMNHAMSQQQQQPQHQHQHQHQHQQTPLQHQSSGMGKSMMANHKPPQQQLQQQQQQQPQYYDQYENYARPIAQSTHTYNNNTMNNINNNHANVQLAYNNAHHTGGNHIAGNNIGHGNNVPYGANNHVYSREYNAINSNAMQAGIGKISDYDPITDGPRNIPNTTRPSSTLIYSSDRGMGKT